MKRFFAITLLLSAAAASAQTASERHSEIASLVRDRNYPAAAAKLRDLRAVDKNQFEVNNYDYLLGRVSEKTGDTATAASSYQRVVNRGSILREYALRRLSEIARTSGNLMLERMYLQELVDRFPSGGLAAGAASRIVESHFESGNFAEVIRLIGSPKTVGSKAADGSRDEGLLLARSFLHSGMLPDARAKFIELLNAAPRPDQPDDIALEAVRGLDLLDANELAPAISEAEHMQRAFVYQFNRDFTAAAKHYRAVIEGPQPGVSLPDAIFQVGRTYSLLGEYSDAIHWFERILEQQSSHPIAKDALLQAATAYSRVGKYREAVVRYERFIENYPDDPRLDRAYLNIVDVLRDHAADSESLAWALKTQEAFKGKPAEAVAVFAQARIHISRSDWTNALQQLEKLRAYSDLGGSSVPGGTTTAEITFLRGFVLEQLKQYPDAVSVYLSVPDGRAEYYGGRATERLQSLAGDPVAAAAVRQKIDEFGPGLNSADADIRRRAAQSILRLSNSDDERAKALDIVKAAYQALPDYMNVPSFRLLEFGRSEPLAAKRPPNTDRHRAIAEELLFLGLFDEGTPELEFALRQKAGNVRSGDRDLNYTFAVLYSRGDMAYRAAAFAEPLWRKVPADFLVELIPADHLRLLYPAPYSDLLLKYTPSRDVDPAFLLAIMRQETRFRADAKSNAAARGLMQFIPETAGKIAAELKRDRFRQDDLYDPAVAILFGAQYSANLFRDFPGQPHAVAGAYNAGSDNMRRWLGRAKINDPDRYVPEIVFAQTKDYVQKVMANHRIYRAIYDSQLRAR